jgi:protein SCO1
MKAVFAALILWAGAAAAQPLALPPPPDAGLQQRIGAAVPLDIAVRGASGQAARLRDFLQPRQPVLLVLGYYSCPQLCGLVMHALLQGLNDTGLDASQWRIVGLSIDPHDTSDDARRRRALDLDFARSLRAAGDRAPPPRIDLLVADPADVQRVAATIGFKARAAADAPGVFVHPATVVVLTPAGTVSRYFNGVGIDAPQLRTALLRAADGGTGGWTDRLAVLCSHLDPTIGRYSLAVLQGTRGLGLLTLAALGFAAWRLQRRRKAP